jgi:predicted membrane channel-forming protein YqfA (hemolysin III family)
MHARSLDILFLVVGLLPPMVVVAIAFIFVPASIALYAPVEDQLPFQTRLVFACYYLSVLLPALVALVWHLARNSKYRGPKAAAFGILSGVATVGFGLWAVYQPELILELIKRSHS